MITSADVPRWKSQAIIATVRLALACAALFACAADRQLLAETPASRAAAYLAAEVERWPRANQCYSCHNNGDGARALFRAAARGLTARPQAQWDDWLKQPDNWDLPDVDSPMADQRLADLQFALAAREAIRASSPPPDQSTSVLLRAAQRAARHLQADGSWPADPTSGLGSPVTYGRTLGTVLVLELLADVDEPSLTAARQQAERWLADAEPQSVVDHAALVMALATSGDPDRRRRRDRYLVVLRDAQNADGGWGPYMGRPTEPFDTALVLLAIARLPEETRNPWQPKIRQAREYLLAQQLPVGGWRETTRPAGRESYAQHISTTAWCLLALLESE